MKTNTFFNWLTIFSFIFSIPTYGQMEIEFEPIDGAINSPNPVQALDISYDDIDKERQAFHIFLPDTEGTFPLVIFYHGGGFISGGRDKVFAEPVLQESLKYFLENNIAFASVGYRVIERNRGDDQGVIKPLSDSKYALQFIRHHAEELNIDPTRIALMGSSAGAGTALWLAVHDDMADPSSQDPVLRESTRVKAVRTGGSQATYDLSKWESVVYADFDFTLDDTIDLIGYDRFSNFYGGVDSVEQIYSDEALVQYRQEVDMLYHMSNDDPPIYIIAGSKASIPSQDLFHHHAHSLTIQTHAIAAGLPEVKANISYLNIDTSKGESANEFLARYLMEVPDEDEQIVLSTSNEDIIDQLSIYPNPTVSELFIQSNLDSPDYQIYDQKGLVVSTGSGKKVDVSTIPAGVYFLKVEARVFRFLKE